MLSIQEMVNKTEQQRKEIERIMDANGTWHPEDANLFTGQKRSIQREISETIRRTPLREFFGNARSLKEFLGKGITGASYLIPNKLHSLLIHSSKQFDIVPLVSMRVIEGWQGGDLKVPIGTDASYKPHEFGGGAALPDETIEAALATLTPKLFGINSRITGELLDDGQWDLIEWHVEQAGKRMGAFSSDLALYVVINAPDGDGTKNSANSGTTDTTTWNEILAGVDACAQDEFIANTLVTTPEAWEHEIVLGANATTRHPVGGITTPPVSEGYHLKVHMLDTLFNASKHLHDATDAPEAAFTTCVSVIFDRFNALLTGRKRWLQIGISQKEYADPVRDLAGAVVSARQDSVSVYKDAIHVLTEST